MEDSVFDQSPFSTESTSPATSSGGSSRRGKKLLFLIILLVVLGLIAFGAVQLLGGQEESEPTPTPTESFELPTDTPTPTPGDEEATPTPEEEEEAKPTPTPTKKPAVTGTDQATGLDRANLSVVVQNGSGEAGVAGTMKSKLEGLGYVVSGTGNADNFDYAQTVIRVKSSKSDFLNLLKKDLSGSYTIGTASADYTGSGDGLVIVGKE